MTLYELKAVNGTYNVTVPENETKPSILLKSIPCSLQVMDGKYCVGEELIGKVVALSEEGEAIIDGEFESLQFSDFKIRLLDES